MKDSFKLYRRLLAYIKPYWRVALISVLAMASVAALNPVLPGLLEPLLDESLIAKRSDATWQVPLMLLLAALAKGCAEYVANVSSQWVANKAIEDLRKLVFDHQMTLPVSTHQAETPGRMMSRITYDVPQVGSALSTAWIVVIQDTLTIIALVAMLLWKAWHLTLVIVAIGPLVALVIRKASSGLRASNQAMQMTMAEMTSSLEESIHGIREIKIFGTYEHESGRFSRVASRLRKETMRAVRVSAANVPLVQMLASMAVAGVIFVASTLAQNDMLTPGAFVSYVVTMAMIFEPIRRLTNINSVIQRGLAGAQSIFNLIDTPPEADAGKVSVERVRGEIRFENLSFAYPGQSTPAVCDFSLTVAPGETVAFVGASGSGKTTLMALAARFFAPSSGCIRIDGIPIDEFSLPCLRSQIGLVGQHAMLFDDMIRLNIAYGRQSASDDEIRRAAEQAHAAEFIANLPEQYDTRIGSNGSRLSGGQRQRLAIARAFLKDAPILLLDEATSALDNESERVVREALVELRRNRTVLVVAHRLTTIRDANRIVVMDRGRIVEIGTHDQLVTANGAYARLLQSGEEVITETLS